MKTLIAILVAMLSATLCASAQKEDNVWIFAGNRIDFTTEPPTVTLVACDYSTEENITSVADSEGNLVYWLNGTSLYNSNDEVIYSLPVGSNAFYFYGLSIVPFPGRDNVYLFVYPDVNRGEMVVSIADGSKDLLHPEITEHYANFPFYYASGNEPDGVPLFFQKYGSRDFWLLYFWFDKIKVYALTSEGFSYTGNVYNLPAGSCISGCEMTPDRSKIVATTMNWWDAIFIDLDTKTGEIKCVNPFTLSSVASYAFSSGNKYMYYSNADGFYRIPVEALGRISTGDEFEANSEFVGASGCGVGDMKFLTSGGVYFHNESNGEYLGVIKDCDAPHPVIDNKWLKLAKNANEHDASWYLAFPKTYCYPYGFFAEEGCGGEVLLTFNDGDSESIHWDFGDGSETTATGQSVSHTYAANGRYTVRFTVNYSDSRQPQVYERSIDIKNIISKRPRIVAE